MSDEVTEIIVKSKEDILFQLGKNIKGLINLIGYDGMSIEISEDHCYIDGYQKFDGRYSGRVHIVRKWAENV